MTSDLCTLTICNLLAQFLSYWIKNTLYDCQFISFFRVYAVVWWRFVFNGYHMCCHELLLIWSLYRMLKYFQKYGYLVCTHARVFLASCRTTVWNLSKCSITLHLSLPFNCSDSNDSCGFYALFNERQKQKKGILIWP